MARGTTSDTAAGFTRKSTTGVRKGPSSKNVRATADRQENPAGMLRGGITSPLKGPDKGAG